MKAWPSILLMTLALTAHAQDVTVVRAMAAAESAVRARLTEPGSRLVVRAGHLSPHLKLPSCGVPMEATLQGTDRAMPIMAVAVRCPETGGFTLRIPVSVQDYRQVLVVIHPLERGDGVHMEDVRPEERDITRIPYGYVSSMDEVKSRTLSRNLMADTVLSPSALGGRTSVRAGDQVELVSRAGPIEVRADGIAMGSGDNGARIRVRNSSSGSTIDAMVTGPGEVLALP